jgi:predicted GNAT family N-acyltransferase
VDVHVTQVPWATHGDRLRRVREIVFIEEQSVPREEEWDGLDETAIHFLALNAAGQPLGCARLLPNGQIGRMAVLQASRGTGLGLRLLEAAIEEAARQGHRRVFLHAQTHAIGFYRKAGFLPHGAEFMEAGIPHVEMTLELPIPFEPVAVDAPPEIRQEPAPPLADPPALVADTGESACVAGLLACLQRPRRTLLLLSPLLDPLLFDRPDVVEAISAFAREARQTRVQILIRDSSQIVARGHRLVELARRLDSRVELRRLPDDAGTRELSFMTWDERGCWLLPDYREYQALRNFHDPVQAKRLTEQFARLWARSTPDPELRLLRL